MIAISSNEMIPSTASPATTFRMVINMAAMVPASSVLGWTLPVLSQISLLVNRLVPAAR